jgi:hypothetical protein
MVYIWGMEGDKAIKALKEIEKIANKNLLNFYKENIEVIDEFRRLQKEATSASFNASMTRGEQAKKIAAKRKKGGQLF